MTGCLSIPNLPDRIRSALKATATPIPQIAERTGVSLGAIKLFATGSRALPPDDLDRLAALLLKGESEATSTAATIQTSPPYAEPVKSSDAPPSRDQKPAWAIDDPPGTEPRYINGIRQWRSKPPPATRGIGLPEFYKCKSGRIVEGRALDLSFFIKRNENRIVESSWDRINWFAIKACELPSNFPDEAAIFDGENS